MSAHSILNLMRELDLRGALSAFERLVSSPQELDAMPAQLLLETLLQNEVNDRLTRKQHSLLRMSHLPYVISPSDIAYDNIVNNNLKLIHWGCGQNPGLKPGERHYVFIQRST